MAETPPKTKPTHITQVSYGMTVNIGNFETVRFDLTAQVAPDEDWRDILASLKRKSLNIRAHTYEEFGGK